MIFKITSTLEKFYATFNIYQVQCKQLIYFDIILMKVGTIHNREVVSLYLIEMKYIIYIYIYILL